MSNTFNNISKEKQDRVLKAAFIEFALHGFENASTNRIVKALNISKGSLFKYFSSKLDLYSCLVNKAVEKLMNHFEMHDIKGDNWRSRLLSYATIEFEFLIQNPVLYRFFYRVVKDLEHPKLQNIKKELYQLADSYFAKIYDSILCSQNNSELFARHISFILTGYNQYFIEKLDFEKITAAQKNLYLEELQKHLDLIVG